jgi:hypothetical protein
MKGLGLDTVVNELEGSVIIYDYLDIAKILNYINMKKDDNNLFLGF